MAAVACKERLQMMRSRGKCSASSVSLLIRLFCCAHKTSVSCQRRLLRTGQGRAQTPKVVRHCSCQSFQAASEM